jgi:hypothetical protein
MREDNLLAIQPKAFVITTDSDHELEVPGREFHEDYEAGGNLCEPIPRPGSDHLRANSYYNRVRLHSARLQTAGGVRAGRQRLAHFAGSDHEFFRHKESIDPMQDQNEAV